ncbi:hypothetical protein GW17_00034328 [Ensete ventricosum]|nr:hypothetical protein GW17_00034328 [Ensete ventricosum]
MATLSLRGPAGSSSLSLRPRRAAARPDLRLRPVRITAAIGGDGAVCEPDLRVRVNGLEMPNPFVIGSGPPGTNYTVMKRAFDEGWGAVIAKTVRSGSFAFLLESQSRVLDLFLP